MCLTEHADIIFLGRGLPQPTDASLLYKAKELQKLVDVSRYHRFLFLLVIGYVNFQTL